MGSGVTPPATPPKNVKAKRALRAVVMAPGEAERADARLLLPTLSSSVAVENGAQRVDALARDRDEKCLRDRSSLTTD